MGRRRQAALAGPSTCHVDIAVLPIEVVARPIDGPNPIQLPLYPMNELANARLRIGIGMEVFILGYPFKIELPGYPVWKRGSIASEPRLASLTSALGSAVKQSEYMLVDTASRPGMSGAPVIRRIWSNYEIDMIDTPVDRFIGVYSGRAHADDPDEAQIGLVWDGSLIEEIIVGKRRIRVGFCRGRCGWVDRLGAMRGPGEDYSDAISPAGRGGGLMTMPARKKRYWVIEITDRNLSRCFGSGWRAILALRKSPLSCSGSPAAVSAQAR